MKLPRKRAPGGVTNESGCACAAQVHSKRFRAVGEHVEHAKAEVVRVAPIEDDAPSPIRRSIAGRIGAVQEDSGPLDVAVQHQASGRVEGVGEVATARRSGSAEHQFALLLRPFMRPAHRHPVGCDDERTVTDVGGCPRHEPEPVGTGEATVV